MTLLFVVFKCEHKVDVIDKEYPDVSVYSQDGSVFAVYAFLDEESFLLQTVLRDENGSSNYIFTKLSPFELQ